jgi:acyl-CoA thioester hydrolase
MDQHFVNRFSWPLRVYYEDTDAGGVVYYANYLKFMERARTEWLRELGFEQDELIASENVLFAVRHVEVEYLKPARLNDALNIDVQLVDASAATMTLAQEITKQNESGVLCKGSVKIVCLTADTFKPAALPPAIRKLWRDKE